jgi:hypothetical protein
MKTKTINLFGGPGSGKSTAAAGLFHLLKLRGENCEIVTEFAKHMTWKEDFNTLQNQIYVHAKQHDRMFHLEGKVDYIITDSPTIMGLIYCDWSRFPKSFEQLARDLFFQADNLCYFIERTKTYQQAGRSQSEEEARQKDQDILLLLEKHQIPFRKIPAESCVEEMLRDIS